MGAVCSKQNQKSKTALVLAATSGLATGMIVLAYGGPQSIPNAIMSTFMVGALVGGGYWLYKCNFNIFLCSGSAVGGAACGAVGSLGSAFNIKL